MIQEKFRGFLITPDRLKGYSLYDPDCQWRTTMSTKHKLKEIVNNIIKIGSPNKFIRS